MSRRRVIDCTFCGEQGVPQSAEDVFPLWLVEKLAWSARQVHEQFDSGDEPLYIEETYDTLGAFRQDVAEGSPGERASTRRRVAGARPSGLKLPDVCEICNRGWMSCLEEAAKRLMPGLMRGKQKTLDPYDQVVLATWVTKTCLAFDAAKAPRLIPEDLGTRRFHRFGMPLPTTHITIGYDDHYLPEGALLHGKQPLQIASGDGKSNNDAVRFAFQFDFLIFQAQIIFGYELPTDGTFPGLSPSPKYEQIWPVRTRFIWPSDTVIAISNGTEGPMPDSPTIGNGPFPD